MPPDAVIEMLPILPPKQTLFTWLFVSANRAAGCVRVMTAVLFWQPFTSVRVTKYVPFFSVLNEKEASFVGPEVRDTAVPV